MTETEQSINTTFSKISVGHYIRLMKYGHMYLTQGSLLHTATPLGLSLLRKPSPRPTLSPGKAEACFMLMERESTTLTTQHTVTLNTTLDCVLAVIRGSGTRTTYPAPLRRGRVGGGLGALCKAVVITPREPVCGEKPARVAKCILHTHTHL